LISKRNIIDLISSYNRIFIVKASKAYTAPLFTSRSLASAGRMDVVARSIISALDPAHKDETVIVFTLEGPPNPPLLLALVGREMHTVPLGESMMGEILFNILNNKKIKGSYVMRLSFNTLIADVVEKLGKDKVLYMHEEGEDLRKIKKAKAFILGDHLGVDKSTEEFILHELSIKRASLGPLPYFTSHCITLIHEELDRINDD